MAFFDLSKGYGITNTLNRKSKAVCPFDRFRESAWLIIGPAFYLLQGCKTDLRSIHSQEDRVHFSHTIRAAISQESSE